MDITVQVVLVEVTQHLDESKRIKRGAVIGVLDSNKYCMSDGLGGLTIKRSSPVSAASRFGYIHVQGFPNSNIDELSRLLGETVVDGNDQQILFSRWIIDIDAFPEALKSKLDSDKQISITWTEGAIGFIKWRNDLGAVERSMIEVEIP